MLKRLVATPLIRNKKIETSVQAARALLGRGDPAALELLMAAFEEYLDVLVKTGIPPADFRLALKENIFDSLAEGMTTSAPKDSELYRIGMTLFTDVIWKAMGPEAGDEDKQMIQTLIGWLVDDFDERLAAVSPDSPELPSLWAFRHYELPTIFDQDASQYFVSLGESLKAAGEPNVADALIQSVVSQILAVQVNAEVISLRPSGGEHYGCAIARMSRFFFMLSLQHIVGHKLTRMILNDELGLSSREAENIKINIPVVGVQLWPEFPLREEPSHQLSWVAMNWLRSPEPVEWMEKYLKGGVTEPGTYNPDDYFGTWQIVSRAGQPMVDVRVDPDFLLSRMRPLFDLYRNYLKERFLPV